MSCQNWRTLTLCPYARYNILILPSSGRYFEVPYGCCVPPRVNNLLVAGRAVAGDRTRSALIGQLMLILASHWSQYSKLTCYWLATPRWGTWWPARWLARGRALRLPCPSRSVISFHDMSCIIVNNVMSCVMCACYDLSCIVYCHVMFQEGVSTHEVDIKTVQEELLRQGVKIHWGIIIWCCTFAFAYNMCI